MRIAVWLESRGNPYQRLFYDALAPYGVEVVQGLTINDESIAALRPRIDAVHFHWPEYIWRIGVSNVAQRARRILGFHRFLNRCRRLDLPIIWTVHNVRAHESGWMDRFGFRAVGRGCDLAIAHSDDVAELVRRRFGARTVTMPLGNYDGVYPSPKAERDTLNRLGLSPGRPTLVIVGGLRAYKGLVHGVDGVAAFKGDVQLIVAGEPQDGLDLEALRRRGNSKWFALIPRALSDQEFSDVIHASSGVLLPYVRITTSSALMSAWTMSRGVVTSPEPYFQGMLHRHPDAGEIAASLEPADIAAAIERFLQIPTEARSRSARLAANDYEWSKCVIPVAEELAALSPRR